MIDEDQIRGVPRTPWREYEITSAIVTVGDSMHIATGVFTTAGAQANTSSYETPTLPSTGALFRDDNRIKIWLNGQLLQKGASVGKDVYWISTTRIAFTAILHVGDVIAWETPAAF